MLLLNDLLTLKHLLLVLLIDQRLLRRLRAPKRRTLSVHDSSLQLHSGSLSGFTDSRRTDETLSETVNSYSLIRNYLLSVSCIWSKRAWAGCKSPSDNGAMLRRRHSGGCGATHSWRRHSTRTERTFFALRVRSSDSGRLLHVVRRHCTRITGLRIARTVLEQRRIWTVLDDGSGWRMLYHACSDISRAWTLRDDRRGTVHRRLLGW